MLLPTFARVLKLHFVLLVDEVGVNGVHFGPGSLRVKVVIDDIRSVFLGCHLASFGVGELELVERLGVWL